VEYFTRYGGCDYVTSEASFEAEACDQGRRSGAGSRGFDFAMVGGASASALPSADVQQTPNYVPSQAITLVRKKSLTSAWPRSISSTRKTSGRAASGSPRMRWRRGCRGCGGRGCRGCRGCAVAWLRRRRMLRFVGRLPSLLSRLLSDYIDKRRSSMPGSIRSTRPFYSSPACMHWQAARVLSTCRVGVRSGKQDACSDVMKNRKTRSIGNAGKEVLQFAPNFTAYVLPPDIVASILKTANSFFTANSIARSPPRSDRAERITQRWLRELSPQFPSDKIEEAVKRLSNDATSSSQHPRRPVAGYWASLGLPG